MLSLFDICEICRQSVPPGHVRPESGREESCPLADCPLQRYRAEIDEPPAARTEGAVKTG